jgi:hypothetical protein
MNTNSVPHHSSFNVTFKPPHDAFEFAIQQGRLSRDEHSPVYAGSYMYMGTRADNGLDTFKRIDNREYLPALPVVRQSSPAMETTAVPTYQGVFALFEYAIAHTLKYPKIRLQTSNGQPVCLSRAGNKSKYTGQIMVTDGKPFGANTFYGRVTLDGEFQTYHINSQVITLLARLSINPAEVASEYGRLTGNCSFCDMPLCDARSTAVGYGPICAKHFGLPWGE